MIKAKQDILALQEQFVGLLQTKNMKKLKELLPDLINDAKNRKDGPVQLYCCMVEAHLDTFVGSADEMIAAILPLTKTDTHFILQKEKGVIYPANTIELAADTYGFYYAVNDYYSKLWDEEDYKLSQNGMAGNPLITNLIKILYTDENGQSAYRTTSNGYAEKAGSGADQYSSTLANELVGILNKYDTTVIPGIKMAFVGGGDATYRNIVMRLAGEFSPDSFLDLSPAMGTPKLNMQMATLISDIDRISFDYVVSSNVLNAFDHHIAHDERDELFASSAKITKQGGKAIHLIEKLSTQSHFNVNLNASMHKAVGQQLVYSFFREKGAMDLDHEGYIGKLKQKNPSAGSKPQITLQGFGSSFVLQLNTTSSLDIEGSVLEGKPDDFRTSMLVMYQSSTPEITQETVDKMKTRMNDYQNRFNYYNKPVYVERPGLTG